MADAFGVQKGGKPVSVSIRFAPRQARWIRERRWHKTARVQEQTGGGLVLHLKDHPDERDPPLGATVGARPRCWRRLAAERGGP